MPFWKFQKDKTQWQWLNKEINRSKRKMYLMQIIQKDAVKSNGPFFEGRQGNRACYSACSWIPYSFENHSAKTFLGIVCILQIKINIPCIARVLSVGFKSQNESAKVSSVVGILNHLGATHKSEIHSCVVKLVSDSEDPLVIPFLLNLSSLSDLMASTG